MIEEIIDVIHTNFPDMRIYTETVEQGLKEPCFLIYPLSSNGSSENQSRMKINNQFMIQYFPEQYKVTGEHTEHEQCSTMSKNLTFLLAHLKSYHATVLNGTIADGVLNFEVDYPELDIIVPENDFMNEYDQNFKEKR
jgi:hypothetical protein